MALSNRTNYHSPRARRAALFVGLSLLVLGAIGLSRAVGQFQGFGRTDAPERELTAGVYLPSDRSLSRAMIRARERLAEREYHQALTFLHDVLARDEDSFLANDGDEAQQLGLKATARRLIGELPPDGLEAFELLNGAAARRQLEAAVTAGNQDSVAQVVRQHFHTAAGYEAALILAQMEADHGHHQAAAQLYEELLSAPRAAAKFEPQLSLLAAANYLAAAQVEQAQATLRKLIERSPGARVEIGGKQIELPSSQDDPAAWLANLIGQPLRTDRDEPNWLTTHGNAARNARPSGGPPHLRARWEARVVNDPGVEQYLSSRNDQFTQRGTVVVPGARPIAVNDVVLMRTPYNLVAIDWHTGKRIWETRDDEELDADELPSEIAAIGEADEWVSLGNPLEQRVWDDLLVTSLASDGERAFIIRSQPVNLQDEAMAFAVGPGIGPTGTTGTPTANQLAAFDLDTEGKLVWEIDGSRPGGPLAGAFFLGGPIAIDNTLFVIVEMRGAIYLVALDPATGNVSWQQQLIGLEQGISLDPARRMIGATPSYADGILVCPLSAGTVVAIDVVKREFAWVYRYPRQIQSPSDVRAMWQQVTQAVRVNNRWLDGTAVLHDGRVFLSPPESNELHCLDLRNGKKLWDHRQGDALFVACVDQGLVLLVGKNAVQALRVSDGEPAWEGELLPLPAGALPTGQGYLSGGRYYLPVLTGGVVAIDLAEGKVLESDSGTLGPVLGNLICYRGSVLSQTPLLLDKFEQADVMRRRAETSLAANPDDATALRELAEMRRADGKITEAVELLKRAHELAPEDPVGQEMLAEALLAALDLNYPAFRDDAPLVRQLVHGREQAIELFRIEAAGLERLGQRMPAFEAYLRLVDFTTDGPAPLQIDPKYSVRSDHWVSGRLEALWQSATSEEQAAMAAELNARRQAAERQPSQLRHFLNHFALLPGAEDARLQLARWLVDRRRVREAELEILALGASNDVSQQAAAAVLMTRLIAENGIAIDAEPFASMLTGKFHDVQSLDGMTGGQWYERLRELKPEVVDSASTAWPRGTVTAHINTVDAANREEANRRAQQDRQSGLRRLQIEQNFWPGSETTQWFISTDCSELVGRDALGDDVFHMTIEATNWARQYRDTSFVHAARLGQLLFASLGGQIVAIDSRQGNSADGDVLWQAYPMGRFPLTATAQSGAARRANVYDVWSSRRRMSHAVGPVVASLGPVTPRGVVYQEQNELKCVDPLTGEALWAHADLPAGCELFGDDEIVIAADPKKLTAHAFAVVDGRRLAERRLTAFPWMLTAGRNVAQREIQGTRGSRRMLLRVTNAESNEMLFEADYHDQAKMAVVEPQFVAVYEPSGKFQLIDVQSATVKIDEKLEPIADLQNIHTLVDGDALYLFVNSRSLLQQPRPFAQPDYPLINGLAYALDMSSGSLLWPGPAVLRHRGIALPQPRDLPFLIFVDRRATRDARGDRLQLRLLCLDKRTGQTVYRNDNLPDTSATRLRIRSERGDTPRVTVEMTAAEVSLTMTDQPRPPQPPANDEVEMARSSTQRGLWGVAGRMAGAVQNALENQPGSERARRQGALPDEQPAEENSQQTDDD